MSFGEFLKDVRVQSGFKTQKQLAEISGVSQTTLSRIEAGFQKPQPDTLKILAPHLRVTSYGELMERAGYFNGLPDSDKSTMSEFFNEHEQLDINIEKTIAALSNNGVFSEGVKQSLKEYFLPLIQDEEIVFEYSPDGIKIAIKELDPNLDKKSDIFDALTRIKKIHSDLYTSDNLVREKKAPYWATPKDIRDFKKMLEEDAPVMFDGVPIEGESRQRVLDVLTGLFWEAKEMNKKTYGRKNTPAALSEDDSK